MKCTQRPFTIDNADVTTYLKKRAREIQRGYGKKAKKLKPIIKKLWRIETKYKRIKSLCDRIINPPLTSVFPKLPNEMIFEAANWLPPSDALNFALTNRHAALIFQSLYFVSTARNYGYDGEETLDAKKYLQDLVQEIKTTGHQPREFLASLQKADFALLLKTLNQCMAYPRRAQPAFSFPKLAHYLLNLLQIKKENAIMINPQSQHYLNLALVAATEAGSLEGVETLIELGADIDWRDSWGWSALIRASTKGHKDIVVFLVEKGARLNFTNKNASALMSAAANGHVDIFSYLIEKGTESSEYKIADSLHHAIAHNQKNIVKFILDKKLCHVDAHGSFGCPPLYTASESCHKDRNYDIDIIRLLLQQNPVPYFTFYPFGGNNVKALKLLLEYERKWAEANHSKPKYSLKL